MEIKAVKFRTGGFYAQPFVFGGEEGAEKFDPKVRYRGSLQNYLIDTGDEVILVDTGLRRALRKRCRTRTAPCIQEKTSAVIWRHLQLWDTNRSR